MNSMEEKLWAYIDGSCTDEEQQAISLLIEQDDNYKNKYRELLDLNMELTMMELDEPSMGFTYNVLENIRAEHAKQPLKTTNLYIVKGIATFFIFTISVLLIFTFVNINWSESSTVTNSSLDLNLFKGSALKIFMFADIILGLFLADSYLRKRSLSKQRKRSLSKQI